MTRIPLLLAMLRAEVIPVIDRYIAWKRAIRDDAEMADLWKGTKSSLDSAMSPPLSFNVTLPVGAPR